MSYDLAQRLIEVRARAARLRSEAFIDYEPMVCGVRLRPVTLATYNRLLAFESPFVTGGPVDLEALAVFVWLHHPDFSQHGTRARRRVLRRVHRALFPRWPRLNALLLAVSTLPRFRWLRPLTSATEQQRHTEAAGEIRRLLDEALHDYPSPGSSEEDAEKVKRQSDAPPIAFQASILNTFRRALDIPYAETEALPLKRLIQLYREVIYTSTGGKGLSLMRREEAAIWSEHLGRKNAAAATTTPQS